MITLEIMMIIKEEGVEDVVVVKSINMEVVIEEMVQKIITTEEGMSHLKLYLRI